MVFIFWSYHHKMVILIDDDKMIQLSWELKATKTGTNLKCFFSVEAFLEKIEIANHDCVIYIDSELGNGSKGEIEARKLFEMGFKNIFLSTGYQAEDFDLKSLPWIKGIINKRPPF